MRQKGQSLVELALTLPILLLVLVGATDIFSAAADLLIAKNLTARAARGAALSTVPDGVTSCQERVDSLMQGEFFLMAESSYIVTNCPADQYQGIVQGSEVVVELQLQYHPSFLPGDPWNIVIHTTDYGR